MSTAAASTAAASESASTPAPTGGLHIGLWVAQILLALPFTAAGLFKLTTPLADLTAKMAWIASAPAFLPRFIGLSELLGGIGLILPAATRIQPRLTPLAALGLLVIMILAALFHASRGEWHSLPVNIVLGAIAGFIAWGRLRQAPIPPRS